MNLTIHDTLKSLIFRHGGNQDDIENLKMEYKNNNCAGFVDGDVNICISEKASFANLVNLFSVGLPTNFDAVSNAGIVSKAWSQVQKIRKL